MDQTDPCLRCGYDLRGIPDSKACPECGLLAGRSRMPTDELRNARPKWLFKLSLGIWCMLSAVLPLAAYFFIVLSLPFGLLDARFYGYRSLNYEIPGIILPISTLLFAEGIFLLTTKESHLVRDVSRARRRRDLRSIALLLQLPIALFTYETVVPYGFSMLRFPRMMSNATFTLPLIMALVVLLPLPLKLSAYLRDMARRVSSRRMIEHSWIIGTGWTVCLIPCLIHMVNETAYFVYPMSLPYLIFQYLTILLILLFGSWSAFALIVFAREFARASRDAKLSWALSDMTRINDGPAVRSAETPPATDHAKA